MTEVKKIGNLHLMVIGLLFAITGLTGTIDWIDIFVIVAGMFTGIELVIGDRDNRLFTFGVFFVGTILMAFWLNTPIHSSIGGFMISMMSFFILEKSLESKEFQNLEKRCESFAFFIFVTAIGATEVQFFSKFWHAPERTVWLISYASLVAMMTYVMIILKKPIAKEPVVN